MKRKRTNTAIITMQRPENRISLPWRAAPRTTPARSIVRSPLARQLPWRAAGRAERPIEFFRARVRVVHPVDPERDRDDAQEQGQHGEDPEDDRNDEEDDPFRDFSVVQLTEPREEKRKNQRDDDALLPGHGAVDGRLAVAGRRPVTRRGVTRWCRWWRPVPRRGRVCGSARWPRRRGLCGRRLRGPLNRGPTGGTERHAFGDLVSTGSTVRHGKRPNAPEHWCHHKTFQGAIAVSGFRRIRGERRKDYYGGARMPARGANRWSKRVHRRGRWNRRRPLREGRECGSD